MIIYLGSYSGPFIYLLKKMQNFSYKRYFMLCTRSLDCGLASSELDLLFAQNILPNFFELAYYLEIIGSPGSFQYFMKIYS